MKDVIVLKKGPWVAGVCPRLGGNLIYLLYKSKNVLRPLVDESQIDTNPYLQGSPILLPANRTYLGKFTFEGVEYSLPVNEASTNSHLHGLVHRQPFFVVDQTDTSVTMKYVNKNGQAYPFDFEMTVTYTVDESGLSQKFDIKNIGEKNMPYTFCLHTTFAIPYGQFTFPIKERQEAIKDIPTGRYIELTDVEKKFVTGSPARDVFMCGYYSAAGHTVTVDDYIYTVSENFDHWITWNAHGKEDYVCLEPQAGKVNGLNIPDGHRVLAPGENEIYTTKYSHA